jgi:hydroxymethylpyrimidine/phosphomethylpyrimidine kinase
LKKKRRTRAFRSEGRLAKARLAKRDESREHFSRTVKGRSDPPACVLTIAGSDSSGGAGIQADARAIHALGGYAATAITAITAQNTRGILAVAPVSPNVLAKQVQAVLDDLPIAAVKIGLVPSRAALDAIAQVLRAPENADRPLVIDPVLASTRGKRFLPPAAVRRMKEQLFSRAALVTPNWPEAEELSGIAVASASAAVDAARTLIAETRCSAILVKGGHGPGRKLVDILVKADGSEPVHFEHARISSPNTHGTGCVLSAAIATRLAQGWTLENAVGDAIDFLQGALAKSAPVLWSGRGPCLI